MAVDPTKRLPKNRPDFWKAGHKETLGEDTPLQKQRCATKACRLESASQRLVICSLSEC
jgi:hypothetical protein